MKMAAKVEEKRKHDFFAKQEHHEQLREEHLQAQDRDRELQVNRFLIPTLTDRESCRYHLSLVDF